MPKPPFDAIWRRIAALQGETFTTKTGREFTFRIKGTTFYPSRTEQSISRKDFKAAYTALPLEGPGAIRELVRGPSYVWAVLHDPRVSHGEW